MMNLTSDAILLSMITFYFAIKLYLAFIIWAIHTQKVENEQEKNGEKVKKVERGTKHTIRDQKLKQKDMKNIFKV